MHRSALGKSDPDACRCRSTTDPAATVAALLLGPPALLQSTICFAPPNAIVAWVPWRNPGPIEAPASLALPPPRA